MEGVGLLRMVLNGPVFHIPLMNCDGRLRTVWVENSWSVAFLGDEEEGGALGIGGIHQFLGEIERPFTDRPDRRESDSRMIGGDGSRLNKRSCVNLCRDDRGQRAGRVDIILAHAQRWPNGVFRHHWLTIVRRSAINIA